MIVPSIPAPRPLAQICAELDDAEMMSDDRIGGPDAADTALVRALEREIGDRPAESIGVVLWRARRLARAVLNEWCAEAIEPLAEALDRDVRAFGR